MKLSVAFFALFAQSAAANDFAAFKERFNKVYTSVEEELKRAEIFAENLLIIAERNAAEIAAGGEAVHGITKVSLLWNTSLAVELSFPPFLTLNTNPLIVRGHAPRRIRQPFQRQWAQCQRT